MVRARVLATVGVLLLAAVLLQPTSARAQELTIFAAASLKTALDEVNGLWARTGRPPARIAFAGSPALARQIEAGAPADLFLSADLDWMDHLDRKSLLRPGTRRSLLGNALVLVAPKDSAASIEVAAGLSLDAALGGGRLAMANVDSVPAGKYGKAALETLGAWEAVKGRVAQAENVRAALLLVSRGEAPLGIVYATDAAADPGVRIVGRFPADSHPPIVYPAAVVDGSRSPDAAAYLAFLRSPAAVAAFERQGFAVLE